MTLNIQGIMKFIIGSLLLFNAFAYCCTANPPYPDTYLGCPLEKYTENTDVNRNFIVEKLYICDNGTRYTRIDTTYFIDQKKIWLENFNNNNFIVVHVDAAYSFDMENYDPLDYSNVKAEWLRLLDYYLVYPYWNKASNSIEASFLDAETCTDKNTYQYYLFCKKYLDIDTVSAANPSTVAYDITLAAMENYKPNYNIFPSMLFTTVIGSSFTGLNSKYVYVADEIDVNGCMNGVGFEPFEWEYSLSLLNSDLKMPDDKQFWESNIKVYNENGVLYIISSGVKIYLSELSDKFIDYSPLLMQKNTRSSISKVKLKSFNLLGQSIR